MRGGISSTCFAAFAAGSIGCASRSGDTTGLPGQVEPTGTLGLVYTTQGGVRLDAVSYALTDGMTTTSGAVNVSDASALSFTITGVASGCGYTVTVAGVTSDGTQTCTGQRAGLCVANGAVSVVALPLACAANADIDGGIAIVTGAAINCPTWDTLLADPTTLPVAAPGNVAALTAHAAGPDPSSLSCSWSVPGGQGTIVGAAATDNAGLTRAAYTCPSSPGTYVLTLSCTDGPPGACPAWSTTGTVTVTCN
jgi:hypothetical protein